MLLFGGAVQAMVTAIKNNRNVYKRRTGNLFSNEKNSFAESTHQGTQKEEVAPKSKEEVEAFQQEVQWLKNREHRRFFLTIITIISFVLLAAFFYIRYDQNQNAILYQTQKKIQLIKAKEAYQENMQKGIRYMKNKKWFYAIGYFENALDVMPNDINAQKHLVESYYSFCLYKNRGCKKTEWVLNDLLQKESNPQLRAELNNKLEMLQSKKK